MNTGSEEKNKKIIRIVACALLIGFAAVIYYMQYRYPFSLEDLYFLKDTATGERLTSLGEIFATVAPTMSSRGGSVLSLLVLRVILVAGNFAANAVNMIMLFAVAFLISRCARTRKEWMFFTAFSFVLMFSLNSEWRKSYLWEFGIVNFLFPAVPFLIYLYMILREINEEKKDLGAVRAVVACVSALAAGAANISYGVLGAVVGVSGIIILRLIVGVKPKLWVPLSVGCNIAGAALYLISPGNYATGSIMGTQYINFSIFPAVVLALLMLAISLRSGGWVSISEMVLIATLGVGIVLRFIIQAVPGVYPNGLQVGIMIVAITLLSNILGRFIRENPKSYKWALLLTVCGFVYIVLNIVADIGGVS